MKDCVNRKEAVAVKPVRTLLLIFFCALVVLAVILDRTAITALLLVPLAGMIDRWVDRGRSRTPLLPRWTRKDTPRLP